MVIETYFVPNLKDFYPAKLLIQSLTKLSYSLSFFCGWQLTATLLKFTIDSD